MTEKRRRRALVVAALAVAGAAMAFLAFGGIGENLVYYWTPSEMKAAGGQATGAIIRLGGLVVPGSIVQGEDGLDLRFEVTDGDETVAVHATTVPPAMFRGGIGVVVEGSLHPQGHFKSSRLMVKHDNEYRAPGSEDERDLKELMRSLEPEASG